MSWTAPYIEDRNGIIREYRVNLEEVESSQRLTYSTTNTFITVQSLHPFYTYRCGVSAFTVDTGPFTNFTEVTLPEDGTTHSFVLCAIFIRVGGLTDVAKAQICP